MMFNSQKPVSDRGSLTRKALKLLNENELASLSSE